MGKLKYSTPEVIPNREEPPIDKGPLPPVEFVKHWIAMFGDFKDGKLEKSKVMKPKDLSVDDVKYLIDTGIPLEKIAAQYRFTSFSEFQNGLIKHGLLKREEQDNEVWFNKNIATVASNEPLVKILKGGISFNANFCELLGDAQYIHLAVTSNNQIKIKISSDGLKLNSTSKHSSTKRLSCAPAKNLLLKQGTKIPAVFKMEFDSDHQYWIGVLQP